MVISYCIIFLSKYIFTHSIQETENQKNTIHNYLNTSEENYLEEHNSLISLLLKNENTNTDITANDNQNNANFNSNYHEMNVISHENIDDINVFGSVNPQNIYNSQRNPENFSNVQHNQETTYNSQYLSQNTNKFSSSEGNSQMKNFSNLGRNYFTNIKPLNYFDESPIPNITLDNNQNNTASSSNLHHINSDANKNISSSRNSKRDSGRYNKRDISSKSNNSKRSSIGRSNTTSISESSNPKNPNDHLFSFANNLQMEDNSSESDDSSDKTKIENTLSKDIIITNFKKPNEVKSSDFYQHILKLISIFVYFERPLTNLGYLLSCGIFALNKEKNISKDQLENKLTSLVDNLIIFNEKNKNLNFNSLNIIKRKVNCNRFNKNKNPENFTIDNYLETTGIDPKECFGVKEYSEIWQQLRYIANTRNIYNVNNVSLCVFFHYISKINEYYNKNMRNKVHEQLVNILLPITKNNQMYIDCSKYTFNNNFIAYWIFELFLQCEFYAYGKKLLYNWKRIKLKLIHPHINVIVFLFLNTPKTIQSLIDNSNKFEKLKQKIQEEFFEIQDEISMEMYTKRIKIKAPKTSKLKREINKISNELNYSFLWFYELAYYSLEKILKDK